MIVLESIIILAMILGLLLAVRQLAMTARVLLRSPPVAQPARDHTDYRDSLDLHALPTVTIVIPAHNEERVIGGCLEAMAALEYPTDKFSVLVVNDRSTDGTAAIVDEFAARDSKVQVLHRRHDTQPGKSAAVAEAMASITSDIVVLFDADYLPRPLLLHELVAPFRDPQVGATMGRVVPYNSDVNVLTKLLDLERRAGYAVDQHARALWGLVPQFGGTVGGIRMRALKQIGGWQRGMLAEDTDLTFRLALDGWKVAYLNEAACYEEVPETWQSRFRQVRRWAYGHNQCLMAHFVSVLRTPLLRRSQKFDALLILLFYVLPIMAIASVAATIVLLAYGPEDGLVCYACAYLGPLLSVAVVSPYLQVAVAAKHDRQGHILRILPFLIVSSSVTVIASSSAIVLLLRHWFRGGNLTWDKTRRFRSA